MKRQTTKKLIIITLIFFILTLFIATSINHIFNYIPYHQDFESIPDDWTLSNSSITENFKKSGQRSLNLSKNLESNLSYAIYDYNFSLHEKEINFWFYYKSIESYTPVDIIFIHEPNPFIINKDFKLLLNTTQIVSVYYNYTLTNFSSASSSIELINNSWYYFSIKFRENDISIYLDDSQILEINDYSLGSMSFEFQDLEDLQAFSLGGGDIGLIFLGKTFQYPFESLSYEMYYDGFEIKEITFPVIPGFPLTILLIITISSIIIVLTIKYRIFYGKIKNQNYNGSNVK